MDELALLPLMASKIKIRDTSAKDGNTSQEDEEDLGYSSDEDGDSAEFYKFFP